MLSKKIAKSAHMFLESEISEIAAITSKNLGLRQYGLTAAIVGIAKKELTRFDRRA